MKKIIQNSWLGGQLDVEMIGRQDYQKYAKGASELLNFNILKRGGITKRQGFDRLSWLPNTSSSSKIRLVPFSFTKNEGFVIVFIGSNFGGIIQTVKGRVCRYWDLRILSPVTLFTNDELNEFDYCQCGYNLYIAHHNHPPSVISTTETLLKTAITSAERGENPNTPFTWKKFEFNNLTTKIPTINNCTVNRIAPTNDTAGGTFTERYKISAVYEGVETKCCSEFFNFTVGSISQITDAEGTKTLIQKSSSSSNSVTEQFNQSAVKTGSTTSTTTSTNDTYSNKVSQTYNGTSYYIPWVESQTLTLNITAYDKNVDYINVYKKSYGTYGLIGTVKNSNHDTKYFSFTDKNITPNTSITPIDSDFEQPMSSSGDYPRTVSIYQQRLVWASSNYNNNGINHRMTVWMSAIGDFQNYTQHEIQKDDDSIEFSMPITKFAEINHLVDMKQLLAFNQGCEWMIGSNSAVKGITYETIIAKPQSYCGSNPNLKPLVCNNSVIFADRTSQSVRRFSYNIQDDGFAGKDISILSSSIFSENPIVDWTYQQYPVPTVWCVLQDGTMASVVIMEDQGILAWTTHKHGNPNAKIKAIACSTAIKPSLADIGSGGSSVSGAYDNAKEEEIFVAVDDGNDMYIERMRVRNRQSGDTVYNTLCLDSCRRNGSGTYNLNTGEIAVNATNGEIIRSGSIEGTNYIIGYPFDSKMTTMYPTIGTVVGEGQFDVKGITNVGIRLIKSAGGKITAKNGEGNPESENIRYNDLIGDDRSMTISNGNVTLKDCDCANIKPTGVNNRDGRITISSNDPWPFTLVETEVDYETETEKNK